MHAPPIRRDTQKSVKSSSGGIIQGVDFDVWSADDIRRISVVEVIRSECEEGGRPVEGGPVDPKFGCLGEGHCPTCGFNRHKCPGHFGHYTLPCPLYHESYVSTTLKYLRCICECGGRVNKGSTCLACGKNLGKFTWDRTQRCFLWNGHKYMASEALRKFKKSGEYDAVRLILTVLPIPPIHVRPPNISGGACRGQSDLTYRIVSILRAGKAVCKAVGGPKIVWRHAVDALQEAVSSYFDGERGGRRTESKYAYSSLAPLLKGKRGLIRGHLLGKRVDQSGRAVIVGDDKILPWEIGLPEMMARTLTVPIKVTQWNKRALEDLVADGGAAYICEGRRRHDLKKHCPSLDVGMVVLRYLKDGDLVLLNRQPSLHAASLMCHKVKVLPGSVLRLNTACTTPYNADYDGDEMNVHVPQTEKARAEALCLLSVTENVLSAADAAPHMGCIQDSVLASWLLSQESVPEELFMRCAGEIGAYMRGTSGKDLLSLCFPPVNYTRGSVRILRGEFISGHLTKKDVGPKRGGLIHRIALDFGERRALETISALQKVSHIFLAWRGFTISLKDLTPPALYKQETEKLLVEALGKYKRTRDTDDLKSARDTMGDASKYVHNAFKQCVVSGMKGNNLNLTSLLACLGQQTVRGSPPEKRAWGGRILPHFAPEDTRPLAQGFVQSSYSDGLSPYELFYHAMSGREGLVDTAIKTSKTGYLSRRLMKTMENLIVQKGLVRDGPCVVQWLYGEAGGNARLRQRVRKACERGSVSAYWQAEAARQWDLDAEGPDAADLFVHFPNLRDNTPYIPGEEPEWEFLQEEVQAICKGMDPLHARWCRMHYTWSELSKRYFTRPMVDHLLESTRMAWKKSRVEEGTAVGAIAAQSLGERTQQVSGDPFAHIFLDRTNTFSVNPQYLSLRFLHKHHHGSASLRKNLEHDRRDTVHLCLQGSTKVGAETSSHPSLRHQLDRDRSGGGDGLLLGISRSRRTPSLVTLHTLRTLSLVRC